MNIFIFLSHVTVIQYNVYILMNIWRAKTLISSSNIHFIALILVQSSPNFKSPVQNFAINHIIQSLHCPIFNLTPTVSSSSLASIQIPSLCLSKAQGGINKRSALQVMKDKHRQVVRLPWDCAHNANVYRS